MSASGNLLWFVFGGRWMGLGWWLAGIICAVTPAAKTADPVAAVAAGGGDGKPRSAAQLQRSTAFKGV